MRYSDAHSTRTKKSETTTENSKATAEAQIGALIEDRVKAVRAKDIAGLMLYKHQPGLAKVLREHSAADWQRKLITECRLPGEKLY